MKSCDAFLRPIATSPLDEPVTCSHCGREWVFRRRRWWMRLAWWLETVDAFWRDRVWVCAPATPAVEELLAADVRERS